jgi:serine/threonine-protein kinase ATR
MLQAQQSKTPFSFIESAKLVKATGDPLRALNELENSVKLLGLFDKDTVDIDLTSPDPETSRLKAKVKFKFFRTRTRSKIGA